MEMNSVEGRACRWIRPRLSSRRPGSFPREFPLIPQGSIALSSPENALSRVP